MFYFFKGEFGVNEYCPSCGTERRDDSDECTYCGAYVKEWQSESKNALEMPEGNRKMDAGERWVLHQLIRIAIPVTVGMIAAIVALIRSF